MQTKNKWIKEHGSLIFSATAIIISLVSIVLQFFWQSHDLKATVVNFQRDINKHTLSAEILFVNRGNQYETIMNYNFLFEPLEKRYRFKKAEGIKDAYTATSNIVFFNKKEAPVILKPGEAKIVSISAKSSVDITETGRMAIIIDVVGPTGKLKTTNYYVSRYTVVGQDIEVTLEKDYRTGLINLL
jgi:hypothetical protein